MREKVNLYRRLARVPNAAELGDFQNELLDRFGPPPEVVERLLVISRLRIEAQRWLINRIRMEDRYLVLDYLAPRLDTATGRLDQRTTASGRSAKRVSALRA